MEAYLEELYKKLSLAEQEHGQFLIEEEVIEETITRGENQSTDFTPYEKALQYTSFEANTEEYLQTDEANFIQRPRIQNHASVI